VAVETLETLGDKHLAKEIIPLLDASPRPVRWSVEEALAQLIAVGDSWLRALAARAAAETQTRALIPNLHALTRDSDPLTAEAARDALVQLGEAAGETTPGLSLMERIVLLREVPLFAALSPDALKQIADTAQERVYSDGALVCREGEAGDELFVLAAGQARVLKQSNGAEKVLATRSAGDFLGEMAVIESQPRFASVRAQGELHALVIEGNAFRATLRDQPEVSLAVLKGLSRRLREKE
jgi:hypothetical protein